ncbi:DUF2029 domain-containing protein [Alloacidobacterium dinghuense]|uniref:DUF2029 domain-containing protein n=1 Tax=Alloacidobacterium dinghuense TaxID=2763107 RepID=A0A7G8BI68_9BACT|nr:glycosyltransferase family 87 protein [Alloacidobacterium dinghuense]QNI32238.1 DUF2029 domain-containing protein [Alloacidobacterium dinghuense]
MILLALIIEGVLVGLYGPRGHEALNIPTVYHALRIKPTGIDSTRWMSLADAAFQAGNHRIYPTLFFVQHEKYLYPPSALFVMEFLQQAPSSTWKVVMTLSWLGCLSVGLFLWRAIRGNFTLTDTVAVLLLGVLFRPIGMALAEGQVQLLITALFGLSLLFWAHHRRLGSGASLSLTCVFKPQLSCFLLWGTLRRQWRFTVGFTAIITFVLAASVRHFGLQNHVDYVRVLSYLSHHGEAYYPNQSLNGVLNRLLHNGDASTWSFYSYPPYHPFIYVTGVLFSLVCIIAGIWIPLRYRWQATLADLLFFGCLAVMISPIAWPHHYGGDYFLFVYLMAKHERLFTGNKWLWLALSYIAMFERFPRLDRYLYGLPSLVGDYLFFGAILALTLLVVAESYSHTLPQASIGVQS